jgi:hypothetical protein
MIKKMENVKEKKRFESLTEKQAYEKEINKWNKIIDLIFLYSDSETRMIFIDGSVCSIIDNNFVKIIKQSISNTNYSLCILFEKFINSIINKSDIKTFIENIIARRIKIGK